jgi:hypothetical protein
MYYAQQGTRYVIVSPPPGAVVYAVPTSTTVVYVGTTPYYYYGGTYYVTTTEPAPKPEPSEAQASDDGTVTTKVTTADGDKVDLPPMPEEDDDQNYKVVTPPVGATVPYLPDEAKEETVKGKKYYVHADTYYRPFASDGDTIYMVVDDPNKQQS